MYARKPLNEYPMEENSRSSSNSTPSSSSNLRPLPEPSSVQHVLWMVILYICRKIVFLDIKFRIAAYFVVLFLLSLISDTLSMPRSFFSDKSNALNVYFVKFGWLWTLIVLSPFVIITSYTYCCAKKDLILKHFTRLIIATFFWYTCTSCFNYIKDVTGTCIQDSTILDRKSCRQRGFDWNAFDASGHSFILIYSTLIFIEEARSICGWEGIEDLIRNSKYTRDNSLVDHGPIRNLNISDFNVLSTNYRKYLAYVRLLFVLITLFTIMWDFMLLGTVLYYHTMPEKLAAGFVAVIVWFFTYKLWYTCDCVLSPTLPGDGLFKYKPNENAQVNQRSNSLSQRRDSLRRNNSN